MSDVNEKVKEAHSGFYLTLVSIIQSLALGYLLQSLGSGLLSTGTLPLNMAFQAITSLLAIILVWHQYAIGTIHYRWEINVIDSTIPYLIGIAESLMIATMAIPEDNRAFGTVRYSLWLTSLAMFTVISILAYWNEFRKAERGPESKEFIAAARISMKFTTGYCGCFALVAVVAWVWQIPQRLHWIVSSAVSAAFFIELVRVNRAYASAMRRRDAEQRRLQSEQELLRV